MATLSEIRAQYPQYNDLSDDQLADAMHKKFYSDMPREDFNKRLGFSGARQPSSSTALEQPPGASSPVPLLDVPGDTAKAFDQSRQSLENRMSREEPTGLWNRMLDTPARLANQAGMAGDVLGMAFSPITGATRGTVGSAMSYLPGMDKEKADAAVDTAMSALRAGPKSAPKPRTITTEELKATADAGFNKGRGTGLEIAPESAKLLSDDIKASLLQDGFRDYLSPATFRAIDELKSPAGPTVTISDLAGVRSILGKAAKNPVESAAASRAISQIDDYLANLPDADTVAGHAPSTARIFQDARGNWAAYKRAETVDTAVSKAERQAGRSGAGANIDNAVRQRISAILNDPKKSRGFSADELAQMEKIVEGTFIGNAARLLGKLAPTGVVSGALGGGAGYAVGGPAGAALLPMLGYGAKKVGDISTMRQVQVLNDLVRSRSPLAEALMAEAQNAAIPRNRLLDALVLGQDSQALGRQDFPVSPFSLR